METYILQYAGDLFYKDRLELLKKIKDWNYKISVHKDGSRINLDKMKPEHIKEIHNFIHDKLDNLSKEYLI